MAFKTIFNRASSLGHSLANAMLNVTQRCSECMTTILISCLNHKDAANILAVAWLLLSLSNSESELLQPTSTTHTATKHRAWF